VSEIQNLHAKKYIALETYKKNNHAVKTPVWFVIHNELVYVITREKTGKVKRLKNNLNVRIAPCTFLGKPIGKWILGNAKFVTDEELKTALELRKKKYGFMDKIAQFASRKKGNLVAFSIKLEK
jgi:hypothetical protein